jgi:hypothetical protein
MHGRDLIFPVHIGKHGEGDVAGEELLRLACRSRRREDVTNGISIEEEANSGYQDHDPLIRLAIDGLIDLSHAHMAILGESAGNRHYSIDERRYLFMVEISRAVGLIEPGTELGHGWMTSRKGWALNGMRAKHCYKMHCWDRRLSAV